MRSKLKDYILMSNLHDDGFVNEIYSRLMTEYDTTKDGLDDTFFMEIQEYISSLGIVGYLEYVMEAREVLFNYYGEYSTDFYRSYYFFLNEIFGIGYNEYGTLSALFYNDHIISLFIEKELYFIFPYFSNDYSKVGSMIDYLKRKRGEEVEWEKEDYEHDMYKYWNNYYLTHYKDQKEKLVN